MPEMNRRGFLAAAGTVAAATAASHRAAAQAPNDRINLGFIGVGGRGGVHLRTVLQIPGVAVRAICDIKPDRIEAAQKTVTGAGQPAPAGTPEWKRLLEMKEVDAVVSALPCDLHAACYLDVIAAGKDLYGEKPMCITVKECDDVVAAAKKAKSIVQIGFQRRADPRFIETIQQVHAGEIGDLLEGRILWSNSWGPLYDWFGLRQRSGNWMVEQACHNWDVMIWANKCLPKRAMGMGRDDLFRQGQADRNVHDYYAAVVEMENGAFVNIVHSWVAPQKFNEEFTRLTGSKGGIDFNSGTFSYRPDQKKADRVGHSFKGDIDSTRLAHEGFHKSIRSRQAPIAGVENGRDAVLACLIVREAVSSGKPVTMKEITG
jgi:myo-inositol 2-dehydrogenase/D-chiro-inositol 1-dehydrogenase